MASEVFLAVLFCDIELSENPPRMFLDDTFQLETHSAAAVQPRAVLPVLPGPVPKLTMEAGVSEAVSVCVAPLHQLGAGRPELLISVLCDCLSHLCPKSDSPSPKISEGYEARGEKHKDIWRVNFVGCEVRPPLNREQQANMIKITN